MKQIKLNKVRINTKTKIIALIGALIIACGLLYGLFKAVSMWYDTHMIVFNKPIVISFNKPIEIKTREVARTELVKIVEQVPEYKDLTDIEKYICDKWGVYDCKLAISIARSESGMREDAFNAYNSNNTIDIGIFQVNSSHFNQPGCSLKDVVDAKKNVDCAYEIYKASSWNAWSAFKSGAFKDQMK
jgi:hypothetical protein